MRRIANIEINSDGGNAEMIFSVDTKNEDERIAIGTYVAKALLDLCAEIDSDTPGITALRFIGAATKLPRSDERVYS